MSYDDVSREHALDCVGMPDPIGAPPWTDYYNPHATEYTLAANGSAVSVRRIVRPVRFLGGSLRTHGGCNLIWNRTLPGGIGFQGHGVTQLPGDQGWLLLAGACIGNVSRPDGPLRGDDAQSLVAFRSYDGWTWHYTATLADIDQYETTLEEMAAATLDQDFKDELSAIEQWFRVLSEPERTAALYALLQQFYQINHPQIQME